MNMQSKNKKSLKMMPLFKKKTVKMLGLKQRLKINYFEIIILKSIGKSWYIYHHHVVLRAQISLTLPRHPSLSSHFKLKKKL